jgi:hypothetical protein
MHRDREVCAGQERAVGAATVSLIEATLSHDVEVVAEGF